MTASLKTLLGGGTGSVPLWVANSPYTVGQQVVSPLDFKAYVCKVAVSGVTDPSTDYTNWQMYGKPGHRNIQRGVAMLLNGWGSVAVTTVTSPAKTEVRLLGCVGLDTTRVDVYLVFFENTLYVQRGDELGDLAVGWELTEEY